MSRILICGHRAYAAKGLAEKLRGEGHEVYEFSRGVVDKKGHVITGPVLEIDQNSYLDLQIDIVINLILLDGRSVEENINYVDSLCRYVKDKKIKRILHFSSISVYPNDTECITEDTPIDVDYKNKGNYGIVKSIVDIEFQKQLANSNVKLIFLRPGFITAPDKKNALKGIAINLPFNCALLMGNSQSTLPLMKRDELHKVIINIVNDDNPLPIYLLVGCEVSTKLDFFKTLSQRHIICLPKTIVLSIATSLRMLHIFDERKYKMVQGLFKVNRFDAKKTHKKLENIL